MYKTEHATEYRLHSHVHANIYTYKYAHTCTHAHNIHTHTHTHVHTQKFTKLTVASTNRTIDILVFGPSSAELTDTLRNKNRG